MRRPMEPVSTNTLLMGTQCVVPCWQTVILIKIPLTMPFVDPFGPKLATKVAVLLTAVVVVLLLLPPQPNASRHVTHSKKGAATALETNWEINAAPRARHC